MKDFTSDIISIITNIDSSLKADKEIAFTAMKKDSGAFYLLSKKLQSDINIWRDFIKSLIREWKNYLEVEKIIEKFYVKISDKEVLYKIFSEYINKANWLYTDDLSKWMLLIKEKNKSFYDLLINSKVIVWKWKELILSPIFIKEFSKELLLEENYKTLSDEDKKVFERNFLSKKLNIDLSKLNSDSIFVFDSILNLSLATTNKALLGNKEKEAKKEPEKEKKVIEDIDEEENIIEDKLDFCLPECGVQVTWWNYYISTPWSLSVELSSAEMDRFTTEGLKNFIDFYNTLYEVWLNFLWDSHKTSFINILNNSSWFNYPDGQWVTESRNLRMFNFLWKSVWLIWWKDSQYSKDFSTLWSVKLAFLKVKEDWRIWKDTYETVWQFANPFKSALKNLDLLSENWTLNTAKFYNVSEKPVNNEYTKEEVA